MNYSFTVADTDLYETDKEIQNLIDLDMFVGTDPGEQSYNPRLTGEYKQIEPKCQEGVKAQLERMKKLCKERNKLYEKQNDLKDRNIKIK